MAYADPPYYGYAHHFYKDRHERAADYDEIDAHAVLIERLMDEFSDGWALSMTSGNLHDILPLCPRSTRVLAWVKPFASFKPSVRVAYAWEPVVLHGGRPRTSVKDTVRDWHAANITMQRGMPGAKPISFAFWLFEVLGLRRDDEFVDLFPGSGAVQASYRAWAGLAEATPLFPVEATS